MNKVLVELYIPAIEKQYDLWIPVNRKIYDIVNLIVKGIESLNKIDLKADNELYLYNKITGERYMMNSKVIETDIRNATQLILM